jgi:hypothetical protein
MFWWYQRDGEFLRYESREVSPGTYVLIVVMPDGAERVEQFSDQSALQARQVALGLKLEAEGWSGPHGWNL